jgi:hypothetical protein
MTVGQRRREGAAKLGAPLAGLAAFLVLLLAAAAPIARADSEPWPPEEAPDPTRLDVERLPPEAIEVTRDVYSHGFYLEGWLGGRGFIGGIGTVSDPGPLATVGAGYELFRWLWIGANFEGSIHGTDGPSPPSPTVFEMLGLYGTLRLQLDFSARTALWLGGEFGARLILSDVLNAYGFKDADSLGLMAGGSLGFDWHFINQHTSLGLLGGARIYPGLVALRDDSPTLGVHGALYLRYVF